ncbi:MAG: GTP 3',8-cyclase MoaA [Planctomycetaceae bacterium]|nr:GTP 3',8-cyclase MoaA [Planctomycetaceae bacterium]
MTSLPPLVDSFGRRHNNLRLSVTDRCNLRCFYCMPADDVEFVAREELLTFEEIGRFVTVAARLGVDKLRITGGEPLVRRDLPVLIEKLAAIDGIQDIGLSTNGILLGEQARDLFAAGLRRINVSLDALDPVRFKEVTRREGHEKVLEGLQAAKDAGFDPIKINAVAIRGLTEDQLIPFGRFARESGVEVRFIEFMPLDADNAWDRNRVLFASEIRSRLEAEFGPLVARGRPDPTAPSSDFEFADGRGRVGFIASVSEPFCGMCNRFRLTADGKLRNCLFSLIETDIKTILRDGGTDEQMIESIRSSIHEKAEGHEINTARFVQPDRPMFSIGG